jgi:hypothetical protein
MAEVLKPGVVFDPIEGGREIYVEEVIGTHTFEQNVVLTFAVNRVQPATTEGATTVRQVVARLVMPFRTANALFKALETAGTAVTLDTETPGVAH